MIPTSNIDGYVAFCETSQITGNDITFVLNDADLSIIECVAIRYHATNATTRKIMLECKNGDGDIIFLLQFPVLLANSQERWMSFGSEGSPISTNFTNFEAQQQIPTIAIDKGGSVRVYDANDIDAGDDFGLTIFGIKRGGV